MKHLSPNELIDLAEGSRAESSAPHFHACAQCRDQLNQMRRTMKIVADTDVPEPSPIFWDHLSSRVRDTIAEDNIARRWWTGWLVPASIAAIFVLAVAASIYAPTRSTDHGPPSTSSAVAEPIESARELLSDADGDDLSLVLVSDLFSAIDLDSVSDAGIMPENCAEHAVTHMSTAELRELRLILQQELGVL